MADHIRTAVWALLLLLGGVLSVLQLRGDDAHFHPPHASHGHDHGEQHRPQRIFSWEVEQARALILTAQDGSEQRFSQSSQGWVPSTQTPGLDDFDVQGYLALLSQARRDREFTPEEGELNAFGLAPAKLQVRVLDEKGEVLADLAVGTRSPDGFGRYVRMLTDDLHVMIVPNYQFQPAFQVLGLDG